MSKIQKYRDEFLKICNLDDVKLKNYFLGTLMTDMEKEFNIPALKNELYNKANPVVMALYKDVSNARCFDGN